MSIKVIVPVHINLGGGIETFRTFLRRHKVFDDELEFIIIIQDRDNSFLVNDAINAEAFNCTVLSNCTADESVSVGRNIGLELCEFGELVSFLDYDDFLLEEFIEFWRGNDAQGGASLFIFNYKLNLPHKSNVYKPPKFSNDNILSLHLMENFTPCLGTTFRKSNVKFDEDTDDIREDHVFWHKIIKDLCQRENSINYVDLVVGEYCPNPKGRSFSQKFSLGIHLRTLHKMDVKAYYAMWLYVVKIYKGFKKYV